jgi:sterol desaturase/sphingolipid hydroxylase (fatty acid hydroxylase superfamily)
MAKIKPNTIDEPIRLFNSDFMEFFTHISPVAVLIIWLAVLGFFVNRSIDTNSNSLFNLPVGIVLGLMLWTLAEYLLHRFLFHFPARTPRQEQISFLFHGIHHEQPRIKSRLVMPPAVSIPLALVCYGLFVFIFSVLFAIPNWVPAIFTGFITGYIFYDMTHYATHHTPMKKGYFRTVRQHHMHHHFQTPNQRFGVTSPMWDIVFKTMPE